MDFSGKQLVTNPTHATTNHIGPTNASYIDGNHGINHSTRDMSEKLILPFAAAAAGTDRGRRDSTNSLQQISTTFASDDFLSRWNRTGESQQPLPQIKPANTASCTNPNESILQQGIEHCFSVGQNMFEPTPLPEAHLNTHPSQGLSQEYAIESLVIKQQKEKSTRAQK